MFYKTNLVDYAEREGAICMRASLHLVSTCQSTGMKRCVQNADQAISRLTETWKYWHTAQQQLPPDTGACGLSGHGRKTMPDSVAWVELWSGWNSKDLGKVRFATEVKNALNK